MIFFVLIGFDAESVDINQFLTYDSKDKVITMFSFTTLDTDDIIKFYKVTQRAQVYVKRLNVLLLSFKWVSYFIWSYQLTYIRLDEETVFNCNYILTYQFNYVFSENDLM